MFTGEKKNNNYENENAVPFFTLLPDCIKCVSVCGWLQIASARVDGIHKQHAESISTNQPQKHSRT